MAVPAAVLAEAGVVGMIAVAVAAGERAVIKGAAGTWAAAPGRDIMGGLGVGTNFGCGGAEAFTIHTRPGLGFIRIGDSK
jgi:hypothetical protein